MLSDLENLVIYFSSILLLFVNLISYYQALTFTHMIYVEITLSNEYMFICFAPSMFVFLNCFATGWCKVSLIALVLSWLHWLFSSVRFQMNLQIVGLSRCKVTSVAFVWLYRASVRFQMSLQTEWSRCSKVTLAAFVWLFDTVCFNLNILLQQETTKGLDLMHFCISRSLHHKIYKYINIQYIQ